MILTLRRARHDAGQVRILPVDRRSASGARRVERGRHLADRVPDTARGIVHRPFERGRVEEAPDPGGMRRGFADDIERMRGRAGHLVEDEHVVVEFLGERPKRRLVQLVERGAVDRRKREAVAEPDRLSAVAQGQGGEQGDLGVAAPHDTRVAPGGDFCAKIALRRVVNEQLRLVSLSLQPFEEEIDDGAHAGADRLRQAHDIGVAGQIGERPRVEKDRLDILRRQMKDEAARSRQRMLRHARREIRGDFGERGAAGPEGEMGGRAGGGRPLARREGSRRRLRPNRRARARTAPRAVGGLRRASTGARSLGPQRHARWRCKRARRS